jgi:redox-sensitive bicupin YhaK (pirin superfamily)
MSAGTGVRHSEFNHSPDERVHFLQIWLFPEKRGTAPSYEERNFTDASKQGRLLPIVTPDGRDGSVRVHQDASIYATVLDGDDRIEHAIAPGRRAYVHVVRGNGVHVNGIALRAGDALKIEDQPLVVLEQATDTEVLLFDLP